MSLQVWLPLNGNLNNQGLSDFNQIINTNPTYVNNGKIGKALSLGSISMPANIMQSIFKNNCFSICFWIYVNADTGDTAKRAMFFGNNSPRRYSLFQYPTCNDLHWSWANDTTNNISGVYSGAFPSYQWTHCAITYDSITMKIYLNGELKQSANYTYVPVNLNYDTRLFENCANNARYLNDYRIYDHALSKKEIEEIAMGLVLHYKLNGSTNIMNPNLIKDSAPTTQNWSSAGSNWANSLVECSLSPSGYAIRCSYSGTTQTSGGMHKGMYDINLIENGATYTLSGWIRASKNCKVSFWNEWMTGVSQTNITTEWKYYKITGVMDTSRTYKSDVCYMAASYVEQGVWIEAFGFKLEKGNDATPWIPHTTDALYAGYSQDLNIVYDSSGYGNNGTITGTITTLSDTPRYIRSSYFDGTTYIINNTSTIHLSNEFTISWWGKINSWKKNWEGMFMLQNTTALNGANGTYSIGNALNANTANSMTLSIRQGGSTYPLDRYAWTYSIGTWAHYACTYKAGVVIMYQNGTQVYTATIADSSSNDYYYTIGRRAQNSNCQMSDFRIYETALTAEQIKELYDTSATIDKNGNIYAREVIE